MNSCLPELVQLVELLVELMVELFNPKAKANASSKSFATCVFIDKQSSAEWFVN